MGGIFQPKGQRPDGFGSRLPFVRPAFQRAPAVFNRPVVTGRITGTVHRGHHQFIKKIVYRTMVQVPALVPFDKQRWSEPGYRHDIQGNKNHGHFPSALEANLP
jgi:hypothetical protein